MDISPIVSAQEFLNITDRNNLVIVDAGSGKDAYTRYLDQHLEGAHYVDLNEDLAEIEIPTDAKDGGRHPLPSLEKFADVLARLGITPATHIIVYDDKNGANAAARFWWMLRATGHNKVQVLNGGLADGIKKGVPTSSEIPPTKAVEISRPTSWDLPTVDLEEIDSMSKNRSSIIIDVRESERYNGVTEPIDLVAGHIPNAINLPFKNNLEANGKFKKPEVLKAYFTEILGNNSAEDIAVHCGSGVTACHTLLAMDYAGLPLAKLYVGSWSEWSRNYRPIANL